MFMEVLTHTSSDICLPYPVVGVLAAAIASGFVYMQKQKDAAINRLVDRLEKELTDREGP